ncbi:thiamine pyrophosphate-binding protein [Herbiconiux daphne]|uniref:Thiamine pyrophosphate-binding protein n=1 Tax=Herbiconiux daphne TaxID=2970914 RepID=A0ABT2H4C7_9MICO|nr:thiamine pyrophosphate-binding protein [Herbiconiux daphne]MCS5734772.1 thiamine pyrophosphate-binding protein [Herbiconiux daphne]
MSDGPAQTVAQQLAAIMAAEGCDHLFTLMGAGNLWLVHHLDVEHGVSIHHLRHENGAVGAADGYARSTGRLGWATVTQGPGFTNTITAMLTADRGRSPLVLLVSDSSNLDPGRFPFAGGMQALAPEALLDPLGILTVRAEGADAGSRLLEAIRRARGERRAIAFVMPAGLDKVTAASLELPAGGSGEAGPAAAAATAAAAPAPAGAGAPAAAAAPAPDPQQIVAAADAIEAAAHPLVVAGRGVIEAGAAADVLQLAELLGARVATTVPASGALGDHPAVVGQFGGFSIGATEALVEQADCLVVIGASLNTFQTRKGEFTRGRTIVRIDLDPRSELPAIGAADVVRRAPVDRSSGALLTAGRTVVVEADACAGTAAIVAELRARGRMPKMQERLPAETVDPRDDRSGDGLVDPRLLSLEFERLLPRDRRVFVDNGHFGAFPMLYLTHRAPRSLVWMPDFGAVGSALGASFASAVADPATASVLFIGDCGLYLTLGDLETAVRERAPLLVVCMNDGAAGSELVHMQDWGVPLDQAIFGYADFAALARGFGAQGAVVTAVEQLEPALAGWDRSRGPFVVDARITREVRSPIYAHV